MVDAEETRLWYILLVWRAKERGSVVESCTRWALMSGGRCLRKAPHKKKQAWWSAGRRASILNIRAEGNMSSDSGRLCSLPGHTS